MCRTAGAISEQDIDEFTGILARPDGLRGTGRRLLLHVERRRHVQAYRCQGPAGDPSSNRQRRPGRTAATMKQVAENVTVIQLDGIGLLIAMEAPDAPAETLIGFPRH
jgi:hypothetical protein